jgi:hypothetical protein
MTDQERTAQHYQDQARIAELETSMQWLINQLDAAYYGVNTIPADHSARRAMENAVAILSKGKS